MKLLLDQNLSPRLVDQLSDVFPGSSHVSLAGLGRGTDDQVWDYALLNGYIIVTKDADFGDLVTVRGFPPKVIWLRLGNCTTGQIELSRRTSHPAIAEMDQDPNIGILSLS